eukprot:CAMPEP_0167830686 /NCGR_PEP_ID=MMETSP0112_2-20121227/13112_1 /TAXON_ID=91324 /ORGANISM="Lotharella globosa, Strain CCCM811" /LENGTH=127 /DNA_ID=CAMNT_0007735037 /DNA_START=45 /DNA_END=425 /DNA_ORIENTATION=-
MARLHSLPEPNSPPLDLASPEPTSPDLKSPEPKSPDLNTPEPKSPEPLQRAQRDKRKEKKDGSSAGSLRLVEISPNEIDCTGEGIESQSRMITIHNISDGNVAFLVLTNAPKIHMVQPICGIVEPSG